MYQKRKLFINSVVLSAAIFILYAWSVPAAFADSVLIAKPIPGGSLNPNNVPKYVENLVIPPVMPAKNRSKKLDRYEITVKQFSQQILPSGFSETTVWGYGVADRRDNDDDDDSEKPASTFFSPSFTIEAEVDKKVRVKWINGLVDEKQKFLPHLLPVDQTLHWANPPGDCIDPSKDRDCRSDDPHPYKGPVPIVIHLHGGHTDAVSDGYPEAWWLPRAQNIPAGFAKRGSNYGSVRPADHGAALFEYDNSQRATTLWYHDHTLGITRLNVYAGLAGFYLLRDNMDTGRGLAPWLPGPAPQPGEDPNGRDRSKIREIAIAIQDRSFNSDGSLFYPGTREFFDGFPGPYIGDPAKNDRPSKVISDVSPIWNPEFFGNMMMVNGRTWPKLQVEPDIYRLRLLNGCDSRFLILAFADENLKIRGLPVVQIGNEGGFLPAPVELTGQTLLLGPAERADILVDFRRVPVGTKITMVNFGPDEPFGGGKVGVDFDRSDAGSTGQVMQFVVVPDTPAGDEFTRFPTADELPNPELPPDANIVRNLSLNEEMSKNGVFPDVGVCVTPDEDENITDVNLCNQRNVVPAGPVEAELGTVDPKAASAEEGIKILEWRAPITEDPLLNTTEQWNIFNFTGDAHPIHLHLVFFEVIGRFELATDADGEVIFPVQRLGSVPLEAWEKSSLKDTVTAYPAQVTSIRATFDKAGLYAWHCHILSHEDNEMMRAFFVKEKAGEAVPEP